MDFKMSNISIQSLTNRLNAPDISAYTGIKNHDWNIICMYLVDTTHYDPTASSSGYMDHGLEVLHTDSIQLQSHIATEEYLYEMAIEDGMEYMADECQLSSVEPGYYRCVCGLRIVGTESTTQDGVEYDTDIHYEMISRTKLSRGDAEYYINLHNVFPEGDAETIYANLAI